MEINVAEILKQISCSWELISLKGNDREYKDKNVIAISVVVVEGCDFTL